MKITRDLFGSKVEFELTEKEMKEFPVTDADFLRKYAEQNGYIAETEDVCVVLGDFDRMMDEFLENHFEKKRKKYRVHYQFRKVIPCYGEYEVDAVDEDDALQKLEELYDEADDPIHTLESNCNEYEVEYEDFDMDEPEEIEDD